MKQNPVISHAFQETGALMPNVLRCKCIVCGDSTAGKSSIIEVMNSDTTNFPENYLMTLGVEVRVKSVNVPDTHDVVELYLHDSSGKELYQDVVEKQWDKPSMVAVVFDLTSENSFQNSIEWLERVKSYSKGVALPGVLIGNKMDLELRRVVQKNAASDFAKKNNLQYFECSAKEMKGVDEPFFYLANEWHKLYLEKLEAFKLIL